ncbi:MAG: hypothetical protein COA88_13990 [Kordia sp.]|nr:MAG: hypothetical protein COA88_13990 [Kordia sp.]
MSKTNNFVFKGLKIVTWIIFIGLCIEAVSLIVNFIFNLYNPELVQNQYQKLDLSDMYEQNKGAFFSMYTFIFIISTLKALLFYVVIKLVSKINLSKPFNRLVSRLISIISYFTLLIGLISFSARHTAKNLELHGYNIDMLSTFWTDSQAFILMAAVIYIIAVIFSKAVENQEELEETV